MSLLDNLSECFGTAADAVALVRGILNDAVPDRSALEQALVLLAEAQSALRAAVGVVDDRQDNDQLRVYLWLRATAWKMQFFISRFMRIEDVADPTSWPDIAARVEGLDAQLQQSRQQNKAYQSSLKRIRYHLKPIAESSAGDREHDWQVIMATVDQLVARGVPPSNADLRELLLPVIEDLPDLEQPPGFARVVREIDRYIATRPIGQDVSQPVVPSVEVRRLADLLRGKTVVLIGGVRRPEAHRALQEAFELKDLDWVETREHESVTTFESHVAHPDVALVILAIRWSSHAFGDVRQYCEKYGKALVRLPAGYNPNQVAVQVLRQCDERLGKPCAP